MMDAIGAGNARDQAMREQALYEERLDALSSDRDQRAGRSRQPRRSGSAWRSEQVSAMQSQLLASEERRRELETGIGVIQSTLRNTIANATRPRAEVLALNGGTDASGTPDPALQAQDMAATLDFMTAALGDTSSERDALAAAADQAQAETDEIAYEKRLMEERNDEIFTRLEEAVTVSMAPLDKMFTDAGMAPDDLIAQVRRGYSGLGGPVMPLLPEADDRQGNASDAALDRAQGILDGLDRMNMYRIAAEKSPFAMPIKGAFRSTSGFGRRWGRLHAGTDFAGSSGTPDLCNRGRCGRACRLGERLRQPCGNPA